MVEHDYSEIDKHFDRRSEEEEKEDIKTALEANEKLFTEEEELKAYCEKNNIPYFPTPPAYTVK